MPERQPMFDGPLRFLSNFDETPFWVPQLDQMVRSAEHAFNALKTVDPAARQRVLDQTSPGMAKQAGRRVPLRPGWENGLRVRAMQTVLLAKFRVLDLHERLQDTGDLHLVETNVWHDNFWGDCMPDQTSRTPHTPRCEHPGTNMLGELLMALRAKPFL